MEESATETENKPAALKLTTRSSFIKIKHFLFISNLEGVYKCLCIAFIKNDNGNGNAMKNGILLLNVFVNSFWLFFSAR